MNKASTIGLDLAKQVFQVHGADATGAVVFRKRLRRIGVLQFFAAQAPCRVAMEACASSHYWGRELSRIGHEVRLIPPAYVKPFVKRQKSDGSGRRSDLRGVAAADDALRTDQERSSPSCGSRLSSP